MPSTLLQPSIKKILVACGLVLFVGWIVVRINRTPNAVKSTSKNTQESKSQSAAGDQLEPIKTLLQKRDIGAALHALIEIEMMGKESLELYLLQAECYRHYRNSKELELCLRKGATLVGSGESIRSIELLSQVQAGLQSDIKTELVKNFVDRGASSSEAYQAVLFGMLYQQKRTEAERLLSKWEQENPKQADLRYMQGMYHQTIGNYDRAENAFRETLQLESRHELAQIALVDLFELPTGSLSKSLVEAERLVTVFTHNPTAPIRLSRILRKQGRADESRQVLAKLVDRTATSDLKVLEELELDLDQAHYSMAQRQLAELGLQSSADFEKMIDQAFRFMLDRQAASGEALFRRATVGAMAFSLGGKQQVGAPIFEKILDRVGRLRRLNDLNHRIEAAGMSPANDREIATLRSSEALTIKKSPSNESQIYEEKCAQCHGAKGDGQGKAARHLFPVPRDFLNQRIRFVTSVNGLASDADLLRIIRYGLAGTSMPGFPELTEAEMSSLVSQIRRFQSEGQRSRLRNIESRGDEFDKIVSSRIYGDATLRIPSPPQDIQASILRGRDRFVADRCGHCHPSASSQEGGLKGARKELFDESGGPILARDFENEALKGGNSLEAIYARITIGIPGTPHPFLAATEDQLMDLSCFIRSISNQNPSSETNHSRRSRLKESD